MSTQRLSIRAYNFASRVPVVGRGAFSAAFRLASPYFLTIPATVESVEPGRAVVAMRQFPWVRNHLGGVHAIALCNLAEMAMGAVAEASVPTTHRWIPKGMSVEYKAKAVGRMRAEASLDLGPLADAGREAPVLVSVYDGAETEVFSAEIRIWVTPKR